jgi:hypothetical protein
MSELFVTNVRGGDGVLCMVYHGKTYEIIGVNDAGNWILRQYLP